MVGGIATLIDLIQHEYGWLDEQVLALPLSRAVQIRDAIYLRNQVEMHARHREIEWEVKHLASVIVQTTLSEDSKWKKGYLKNIFDWDMDRKPEEDSRSETENELTSDEVIEKMWSEGAKKAMEDNLQKQSFGNTRLG